MLFRAELTMSMRNVRSSFVFDSTDSYFPYLHPLEELFYGISLIHLLDIHQ